MKDFISIKYILRSDQFSKLIFLIKALPFLVISDKIKINKTFFNCGLIKLMALLQLSMTP